MVNFYRNVFSHVPSTRVREVSHTRIAASIGVQEGWRLHDLRRTAETGMATLSVLPPVIEAVLNHVSGTRAGVAGIYNRATYREEKRAALSIWARYIESLVSS